MVRMMSPRSPRARRVFSASAWTARAGLRIVGGPALQALQAADQQQALALQPGFVEAFDLHPAILAGLALQGAVEARPALLFHLALQGLLDLQFGARPQPFGRQFGGAMAEAVGDVVAGDDEVFAGVVTSEHDQVGVRVIGVPVIDRHPIQPRARSASMRSTRCRV